MLTFLLHCGGDISTTVILSLNDAPVDFIIEISTAFGIKVTCFPKLAIKNSNEQLPKDVAEYEKAKFLAYDKKVSVICVETTEIAEYIKNYFDLETKNDK